MLAFVGTAFVARQCIHRRVTHHLASDSFIPASLQEAYAQTPEQVEINRSSHVSKSCSVSYANSGALQMQYGQGSRLYDIHGTGYLDTRNNVCHDGHQHPQVVQAIMYQVQNLNTNTRYLHPNSSLLAKKLADILPSQLEVVFFVNSGSEANDLALRLARAHTYQSAGGKSKKQNVIAVDHAYHGHTLATLNISPYKHHQGNEMTCPDYVKIVPYPDLYRGEHSVPKDESELDSAAVETAASKYASYVEAACGEITSEGNSVSAFIIEGGMSVAGVILPRESEIDHD